MKNLTSPILEHCPFCGDHAEFEYKDFDPKTKEGDDGMGWAKCQNPKCGASIFDDRESAILKWNTGFKVPKELIMTNVKKLSRLGILQQIRRRLGAGDGEDTSYDNNINKMSNTKLISAWSGWILGDQSWWDDMKRNFDGLEELDRTHGKEKE